MKEVTDSMADELETYLREERLSIGRSTGNKTLAELVCELRVSKTFADFPCAEGRCVRCYLRYVPVVAFEHFE